MPHGNTGTLSVYFVCHRTDCDLPGCYVAALTHDEARTTGAAHLGLDRAKVGSLLQSPHALRDAVTGILDSVAEQAYTDHQG